jgi:hypothetical protein
MPGKATVKKRGEPVGLDVVGVSASYGKLRALDPIDVTVPPGGLVLVVGPNGPARTGSSCPPMPSPDGPHQNRSACVCSPSNSPTWAGRQRGCAR